MTRTQLTTLAFAAFTVFTGAGSAFAHSNGDANTFELPRAAQSQVNRAAVRADAIGAQRAAQDQGFNAEAGGDIAPAAQAGAKRADVKAQTLKALQERAGRNTAGEALVA